MTPHLVDPTTALPPAAGVGSAESAGPYVGTSSEAEQPPQAAHAPPRPTPDLACERRGCFQQSGTVGVLVLYYAANQHPQSVRLHVRGASGYWLLERHTINTIRHMLVAQR